MYRSLSEDRIQIEQGGKNRGDGYDFLSLLGEIERERQMKRVFKISDRKRVAKWPIW